MRRLACACALAVAVATAAALLAGPAAASPLSALRHVFSSELNAGGGSNGALVVDLSTGQTLYAYKANVGRLPASNEKIYTTSTALLRYGPSTTLKTTILGVGTLQSDGTFDGSLYLHGGGDPSFGSASYDNDIYGRDVIHATMQSLVAQLVQRGITKVNGPVYGDASFLDSAQGTAPYGYKVSFDLGSPLSGLLYNRGWSDLTGYHFQSNPPLYAAQELVHALRAARVKVPGTRVFTGKSPAGAQLLASVSSPAMSKLIALTNTPSDNLFAETLIKDLGASFGGRGSTAAGAAVVRAEVAAQFGIHPKIYDGSGLSYRDSSSPADIVTALTKMAGDDTFVNSLAVAGETGTLEHEMVGTVAQGRCRGKTGTLAAVSDLSGYCQARDGHTLVFSILQNYVSPNNEHGLQNLMAEALARYNG
ncbi:MAG TPA: D-alanyl-D-alanine carboxypeptidase/D-alanyl-D-alanine-endopeptidase [Solirubrobacteraceae bacterium]|nr:D-alanyl-D-alanine carboxypeptidase/D-alanyl-D-alanine-endopeptidase [Solirubrobacteraceae bacterium]